MVKYYRSKFILEVVYLMSEENKETLQENEAVVPETETVEEVLAAEDASADKTIVEKEAESVQEEQTPETSETSTEEESAEGDANSESGSTGDVSFSDYIDSIPQVRKGATIKGTIIRYDDEYAYVDIHDKSEGKINIREFDKDPNFDLETAIAEKKEIDVFVKNIRYTDTGKDIQLSKARVDFSKHKDQVEEAYENKEPITVNVYKQVKDGVIASYGSVDIYLHRTQIDNKTLSDEELQEYDGKDIEILVTQFDPNRRRLRVSGSRRTLINQERKERAQELWANIAVGDIYEGVVRNITKFGAFVDLGGVDGLVHISELSWDHIKHPSEVISVGDAIQVYVKDFDQEQNRISLGYKRIEDDPYNEIDLKFPVGSIVSGKVVRILNFGAFIEIEEGVDALCHISEISDIHLDKPSDVLEVGQEVTARVLDVSSERRRISVSIKAVEPMNELRGEAAERQAKREAELAKKNANRPPKSYQDKADEDNTPSDMELAFAAARVQAADSVDEDAETETVENEAVEDTEVQEVEAEQAEEIVEE